MALPTPNDISACALVTSADITELTGKTYDPPNDASIGCTYAKGDDMVIVLATREHASEALDAFKTSITSAPGVVEVALPGGSGWRLPNIGTFAMMVRGSFVSVSSFDEVPTAKVETVMKRIATRL